jgi:hypothetical protein
MLFLTWFSHEPDPVLLARHISPAARESPVYDRAGYDDFYGGQAERVLELAQTMRRLAAQAESMPRNGTLLDWARSIGRLRNELIALVEADAFAPPARGWEGPGAIAATQPRTRVLAVLDICAHLICNRLGVTLDKEGLLRHCASRAVGVLAEGRS